MADYGYTLFCEGNDPLRLVDAGTKAEAAGFDFLAISDHIHPWVSEHEHSPFAWSILGALAVQTERVQLATMVTCPFLRYHPAVVAQMAATTAVMSGGRFTLGLGAGERLNEHVVGRGWPPVDVRHEMLREAVEAITELWQGGYTSYDGDYLTVEDCKLFDLPDEPIDFYVGASGDQSATLAAELGGGICSVEPLPEVVSTFTGAGGDASKVWGQVPLSWHEDEATAVRLAKERFRFGLTGWKVMSELPNPSAFDAATQFIRDTDVAEQLPCGPDPERHAAAISEYLDAGYQHVAVAFVGDDVEGFLRFWQDELRPRLD